MKNYSLFSLISALFLLFSSSANSQVMPIFEFDKSNYPLIEIKMMLFNNNNDLVNLDRGMFKVTENGTARTVVDAFCKSKCNPSVGIPVSITFAFDISGSMAHNGYLEIARDAVKTYLSFLEDAKAEFALTTFNDNSYINSDFTYYSSDISSKLNALKPYGGTNYSNAFMDPNTGALTIAANSKEEKKFLIFITDGLSESETDAQAIINKANADNIIINCITLGLNTPQELKDISTATGGKYFEGKNTLAELQELYFELLQIELYEGTCGEDGCGEYGCFLIYESGPDCNRSRSVNISVPSLGISRKLSYKAPFNTEPIVLLNPTFIDFGEIPPGDSDIRTIELRAKNMPVEITAVKSSDPVHFKVLGDQSFTLIPGNPVDIELQFLPSDSSLRFSTITIESSGCPAGLSVGGGFKPEFTDSALTVTFPNGGEDMIVGTDSIIRWEGVSADTKVKLEYSTDEGTNWIGIKEQTSGLEYDWKVPNTPSNQCLARASEMPHGDKPELIWKKKIAPGYSSCADIIPKTSGPSSLGNILLTVARYDSKLILWDMDNIEQKKKIKEIETDYIIYGDAKLNPAHKILAYRTNVEIVGINWETEEVLYSINTISDDFEFSHDGKYLTMEASEIIDKKRVYFPKLYDALTGEEVCKCGDTDNGHQRRIWDLEFSHNDEKLYTYGDDLVIYIWRVKTGELIKSISMNKSVAYSVDFDISPDDGYLVIGDKSSLVILETENYTEVQRINEGVDESYIRGLKFNPNGNGVLVFKSDYDEKKYICKFYNWYDRKLEWSKTSDFVMNGSCFDKSGSKLVTTGMEGDPVVWDINGNKIVDLEPAHNSMISDFHYSNDNKSILMCALYCEKAFLVDAADGSILKEFDAGEIVNVVNISNSGEIGALGLKSGIIKLINLNTWQEIGQIKAYEPKSAFLHQSLFNFSDLIFSKNEKTIIASNNIYIEGQYVAKSFNVETGELLNTFISSTEIKHLQLSSDEKWLVTSGIGDVIIWDFSSGAIIKKLEQWYSSVRLSRDMTKMLVSYSNTTLTGILDLATNKMDFKIKGWRPVFANNERIIISEEEDSKTLYFYDASNGLLLNTINNRSSEARGFLHQYKHKNMTVSNNSRYLTITTSDSWVYTYELNMAPVQQDISDSLWTIVAPAYDAIDIIDMQKVLVGSYRDSLVTVFLANTSTVDIDVSKITIAGTDKEQFSIVSGHAPFTIPPMETKAVEFRFKPNSAGHKSADIEISTKYSSMTRTIIGEGVISQLAVIADVIDFEKVKITTAKDTLVEVVIRNIGTSELSVTDCKITGPDFDQFMILSGGGAFTLSPGASKEMQLQFSPEEVGKTSSNITFYANDTEGQKVQLLGEGVDDNPKIYVFHPNFGRLICNETDTADVEIVNSGTQLLSVSNAAIIGTNADEFSFVPNFTPFSVEPDTSGFIKIMFKPKEFGLRTAELQLSSNDPKTPEFSVPLEAVNVMSMLELESMTIDLGILCPGETKDTNIVISALGDSRIGAYITSNSDINSDIDEFLLSVGEEQIIDINFLGHDTEGDYKTWLRIVDSTCLNVYEIEILTKIIKPNFSIGNISITAENGSSSKAFVNIENTSARDVTITEIEFSGTDFVLISPSCPIDIQAFGTEAVTVQYTPPGDQDVTEQMIIRAQPCNAESSFDVHGVTKDALTAGLIIGSGTGSPGDQVEIPVYLILSDPDAISSDAVIKTTLEFNATIIYPQDVDPGTVADGYRSVDYEFNYKPAADNVIGTIRYQAMNGNSDRTDIHILKNKTEIIGANIEIECTDGDFNMTGLCEEGGKRLIGETERYELKQCKPNPATGIVDFEFTLIETGYHELAIYNTLGSKVKILSQGYFKPDDYKLSFNSTELTTGLYLYRLETARGIITKSIIVLH